MEFILVFEDNIYLPSIQLIPMDEQYTGRRQLLLNFWNDSTKMQRNGCQLSQDQIKFHYSSKSLNSPEIQRKYHPHFEVLKITSTGSSFPVPRIFFLIQNYSQFPLNKSL